MEPLSGEEIADALQELSDELKRARVKAHLYLVGRAAIAMTFRDSRRTYDLDVLITEGHGAVIDATRRIATRRGWPETWLNQQAASSIPKLPDRRAATVFGSSNLVVPGASAEHLLAMKVRAGRQIDLPDIALLADSLGLREAQAVFAVHDRVFPGDPIPARSLHQVKRFLATLWPRD